MVMVSMKRPPGRPAIAKKGRQVKGRLDDRVRQGFEKFESRPDCPSEAEAVRRLIRRGLEAEGILKPAGE
jgi:hypothetical protein